MAQGVLAALKALQEVAAAGSSALEEQLRAHRCDALPPGAAAGASSSHASVVRCARAPTALIDFFPCSLHLQRLGRPAASAGGGAQDEATCVPALRHSRAALQ